MRNLVEERWGTDWTKKKSGSEQAKGRKKRTEGM